MLEFLFPGIKASQYDLHGQIAVVTGSTSGIGQETAKGLYLAGAHVVIAARNPDKASKTIEDIKRAGGKNSNVGTLEFLPLNLMSLKNVENFVLDFKGRHLHCNILFCNAGLAITDDARTDDGFEIYWDDLPGLHRHSDFNIYCCSKLMNMMYAKDLATRIKADGIHVFCAQPGITSTEMTSPKKSDIFKPWVWALTLQASLYGLPTKTGAIPLFHVAAAPADKLISAAEGEHYGPWYLRPPLWPIEMPVITNALWLGHQKALNPLVHDADACKRLAGDTHRLLARGGPRGLGLIPAANGKEAH